jgi:anti-sigma regulatory factor (Ser/Thr protein kinase)
MTLLDRGNLLGEEMEPNQLNQPMIDPPTPGGLALRLAPTVHAPARARGIVDELAGELDPEEHEALQLLVSELVTNSVRHARFGPEGWIDLQIRLRPDTVRVTVKDPGGGFSPPERVPHPGQPYGWGLLLVQRVADRWGIDTNDHTEVWFELRRAS